MGRKRSDFLTFIKKYSKCPDMECTMDFDFSLASISQMLLDDLHKHYGFIDLKRQHKKRTTNQQMIFELLYLSENKLTNDEIAKETSVNSIEYHLREFNILAMDFVDEESRVDERYKKLLEKFFE